MNEYLTDPRIVFVFGSNLAGRHGKGAALVARQRYGAVTGQGEGLMGRSYGIPTKDERLQRLSLDQIRVHVYAFMRYANHHPELTFIVSAIGCGLAGYDAVNIAPMFAGAPENVFVSPRFIV